MGLTAMRCYVPASQAGTRGGEPWAMQLRCPHSQVCDTANEACGL